jgi:hypothetical protein
VTVTLQLKPDTEANLLARAQASGMEIEEYVLRVVEQAVASPAENSEYARKCTSGEAVQRMLEFGKKHRLSFGQPISRKILHEGHRF